MRSKHMVSFTAAEMAKAIEGMANTPTEQWGVFGSVAEYTSQWARVYPQLAEFDGTLSAALGNIGSAAGWQQLLDTCTPLAAAYRALGNVPSPLCQARTHAGHPCGRVVINGQCSDPQYHA